MWSPRSSTTASCGTRTMAIKPSRLELFQTTGMRTRVGFSSRISKGTAIATFSRRPGAAVTSTGTRTTGRNHLRSVPSRTKHSGATVPLRPTSMAMALWTWRRRPSMTIKLRGTRMMELRDSLSMSSTPTPQEHFPWLRVTLISMATWTSSVPQSLETNSPGMKTTGREHSRSTF